MKTLPQPKNIKNITITQKIWKTGKIWKKQNKWVGEGVWGNPSYTGCTGCTHWKPYNCGPDPSFYYWANL